jgi:cytoskeletal protein CcmA (bactofilin family)
MGNPYDTASERVSVLGPTLRFKGELTAEEDLVVHGTIEGTLGPAPRVTIGPDAKVKANVQATTVIVEGTVHGNLSAQATVIVKETATVEGNIDAPAVTILEGARFNGNVAMGARARAAQPGGKPESQPSGKPESQPSGKSEAQPHGKPDTKLELPTPAKTGTTF